MTPPDNTVEMAATRVLRTRLLPPRLPPGCVARPRLAEAVRRGLEGRLVAVVAGAGYGKTTLLAQVIAEERRPWAWCSCDARILDSPGLVAHIAAGIAESFPGFDARLDLEGPPIRFPPSGEDGLAAIALSLNPCLLYTSDAADD